MTLLGIDIGGTKVAVCVGDDTGQIIASGRIPALAADGPDSLVSRTAELIARILEESGTELDGIPHIVDSCAIEASALGPQIGELSALAVAIDAASATEYSPSE